MPSKTLTITHGARKAVFVRTGEGWQPEWFYEGERKMLRFKDHEWLAIGHVHPRFADWGRRLADGGVRFGGVARYGRTAVEWSVVVRPDTLGDGFSIECAFTPQHSIELLEAHATFETPYEYDGNETVTTVIGMNPVVRWHGATRVSPPVWAHPAWVYSRPQAVRITGPSSAPYICQALTAAGEVPDRYVTIIGDWNVCRIRDLYVTPTRDVPASPPSPFTHHAETRGYKFVAGALNWSSAFGKDPNVLYAGGEAHTQRVIVGFHEQIASLDHLLLAAWQRAARLSLPANGRVAAAARARRHRVSWQTAVGWLRGVFIAEQETPELFRPDKGICTYATGTRPKAGGDYSWFWWPQWAGPLHYRALLTGDPALLAACERHDAAFLATLPARKFVSGIATSAATLPTIHWIAGGGRGSALHAAMRPLLEDALAQSVQENGGPREMDYGTQGAVAEALLLGAAAYDNAAMARQAAGLLHEMDAKLDENFWEFNCGKRGALEHGGQIRSLGHGHAIVANLLAHRHTGEAHYLAQAHRFARYLLAISYACHNSSLDPDFDWRGWCNGSNAGRDQYAEFPPWETQDGLLCISALMAQAPLEDAFYDALWYIARTGLAQFPAARSYKRVLDANMRPYYLPRRAIASERDFYSPLPYLAYENPLDQTLLASYQGTDCLLGELVYGGGLAHTADDRLAVLSPRAATMDLAEILTREIHLWNPTATEIHTTLTVPWPDGERHHEPVSVPPREVVRMTVAKG